MISQQQHRVKLVRLMALVIMWNKRPETENEKPLLLCKRLRLCSRILNDGAISRNRAEVEVTHRALKMACSSWERPESPPLPSRVLHKFMSSWTTAEPQSLTTKCCWVTSSWQRRASALWHACGFVFWDVARHMCVALARRFSCPSLRTDLM